MINQVAMFHDPKWDHEEFILRCAMLWQLADCESPQEAYAVIDMYEALIEVSAFDPKPE